MVLTGTLPKTKSKHSGVGNGVSSLKRLQSSGRFEPRDGRQISMQALPLGSLLAGISKMQDREAGFLDIRRGVVKEEHELSQIYCVQIDEER